MERIKWDIPTYYSKRPFHVIWGLPVVALTLFIVFGGACLKVQSNTGKWNTKMILRFRALHRFLGFLFIALGQAAIISHTKKSATWIVTCLTLFFVLLVLMEIIYWRVQAVEIPLKQAGPANENVYLHMNNFK